MNTIIKNLMSTGGTRALYQKKREEMNRLVRLWEKTGLLEGLDKEEKPVMAQILDNQAREIIDEVSRTGGPNAEEWSGVALPLVRRIFAELPSKDFVSIQPMNAPSGLIFYLDFTYGTKQPGFEVLPGQYNQENSVYGVTSAPGNPTGGLYGAGRFSYSLNDFTLNTTVTNVGTPTAEDVNFNETVLQEITNGEVVKIEVDMTGTLHDINAVRAFLVEDNNTKIERVYQEFTKPVDINGNYSTTKVVFVVKQVSGQIIASGDNVTVHYQKYPVDYARGDFEASQSPSWGEGDFGPDKYNPTNVGANAIDIPEINLNMRSIPIVARTRKLKAVWTPEFAQDLQAYHAIDAEAQLTSILSEYITMEIDLEILEMLMVNAPNRDVWSARVGTVYIGNGNFDTLDNQEGRALAYTRTEWFAEFGTRINKLSNQIHAKTLRGGANFIVVNPLVATVIESMNGFQSTVEVENMKYTMGVQKVGTLNNRYVVYKNPYMPEDEVLVGFKGNSFLETGAVYAPFIPLIMTPVVWDSVNMTPRKGVMTRYAKKIVRPEFYGKLTVAHANFI